MAGPGGDKQLELAHVLCTDIVGYSKLSMDQQSALLSQLNDIVRKTDQFRRAEASGKLIRIPTGDGMILVFFTSPQAPVECALEISKALKTGNSIPLRMGVHSGPVDQISDVNDRSNVSGAGINMAQRVMDCGDDGHILLSKRIAEDLAHYERWQPFLHDLGEFEVKHGVKIHLVNLCGEDAGNPAIPQRLHRASEDRSALTRRTASIRRRKFVLIGAPLLAILLALIGYLALFPRIAPKFMKTVAAISEKSIAVLPFDNFSGDKENAYFTDGMQDEILTDLSKIADLKVISRTSVEQYRGATRNLKDIGKALQVVYILEGSVQKAGGRVRVNTQLIDAETGAHLWAERFDRDIVDLFALQNEIAARLASALQLQLAVAESRRPTDNPDALDYILRGRAVYARPISKENTEAAVALFEAALALDPNSADAAAITMMIESDLRSLYLFLRQLDAATHTSG